MDYAVFVSAEGASVEQIEGARAMYRESLDRGLGGSNQVKPCFVAYAKGKDQQALSPAEDAQSAAWILAEHAARERAAGFLPDPNAAVFTFRLNN